MVIKSHYRIKLERLFGVIAPETSNISFLPNKVGKNDDIFMTGFAENVFIWSMISNNIVHTICGDDGDKVTYLAHNEDSSNLMIAVGYKSGYVAIYELFEYDEVLKNRFHRGGVSCIIFCGGNMDRIICGGTDTDITVCEIVSKEGYRLRGHKGLITQLCYLPDKDVLISSSVDGFIRLWMLAFKHCFKIIAVSSEVWDFQFCTRNELLVTGGKDPVLHLWKLDFSNFNKDITNLVSSATDEIGQKVVVTPFGGVDRQSGKRVYDLKLDKTETFLTCNMNDKFVEIYKLPTDQELSRKLKKRAKKAISLNQTVDDMVVKASDRLRFIAKVELSGKCRALDVLHTLDKEGQYLLKYLIALGNNAVALVHVNRCGTQKICQTMPKNVSIHGHRSPVLATQFTSDGTGLFTVSVTEMKVWDRQTLNCALTIEWPTAGEPCYDGLCLKRRMEATTGLLLPGDRHAVIGFRNGCLLLYSLLIEQPVQFVQPHSAAISTIVMDVSRTSLLTGSADKMLLRWKLDYGVFNKDGRGGLQLVKESEKSTMQLEEAITCAAAAPDGKFIVVAFANNKGRTYSTDESQRRMVDLIGHNEPITSIDIKYDSSEIITGSSDKNVSSWKLPHGERKIFRGHESGVTAVRYIPGRSKALSTDAAGVIIYIELRSMTPICRLVGHGARINSLAIRASGTERDSDDLDLSDAEVVSVGADYSLRMWTETDQELVSKEVEEDAEMQRQDELHAASDELVFAGAPLDRPVDVLTRKTLQTEQSADRIIDAVETMIAWRCNPQMPITARMANCRLNDPRQLVLLELSLIKSCDIEFALSQLPQTCVLPLLGLFAEMTEESADIVLLCRIAVFLCKLHYSWICTDDTFYKTIGAIRDHLRISFRNVEDNYLFTYESCLLLKEFIDPELLEFSEKRLKKKRKPKSDANDMLSPLNTIS